MGDREHDDVGSQDPATRAVHAGEHQPMPRRPAVVPIHQTAPFLFDSVEELDRAFTGSLGDKDVGERTTLYSRYGNPTVRVVEAKVAELEGAEEAVAFASGMAAIAATLTSLLRSGDRILAASDLYGGTDRWLGWLTERQPEVALDRVPLAELPAHLEAGVEPSPRVVYVETPTNPLLTCCDLGAIAHLTHRAGALLVVDNTFATPILQRPLALGADLVVHSATKFLAGHSDVTAGVVAGGRALLDGVREAMILGGACLDPHAAFLVARGMRTLALRVERQSATADRLAKLLVDDPRVRRVHYPGRDPVGRKQMTTGGGMLSFELEASEVEEKARAKAFLDALRLIRILPSLGGVETSVMLPALTSHRELSAEERRRLGIGDGLVRLSVGIEAPGDLEADLNRGLEAVSQSRA